MVNVAFIEIQQVRGATRRKRKQRTTLIGLGLNRIGRVRWVPDTPEVRGMLKRVSRLVQINHDPAAPKPDQPKREYDEAQDAALMRRLAFDPNCIVLEPYSDAELKSGKTPDFKLRKDGNLSGFCEMKSPRDDYVFEPPDEKGAAVRKNIPFYRKLGSHIRQAARQFDAVNPGHKRPNNGYSATARRNSLPSAETKATPGSYKGEGFIKSSFTRLETDTSISSRETCNSPANICRALPSRRPLFS